MDPPGPNPADRAISPQRGASKKKKKKRSKKGKKSKEPGRDVESVSSGSSRSSSSSGTLDSQDSGHPFREGHRVKQLAKKHPGLLTRHSIEEMSRMLVEQVGTEEGRVLPIYLKCLRLTVLRRDMIPGQRRELTTLAHVMDRLELVVNGSI